MLARIFFKTNRLKIDRFVLILGVLLTTLAVIVIFTLKEIFSGLIAAGQIDEKFGVDERINVNLLDKIFKSLDLTN